MAFPYLFLQFPNTFVTVVLVRFGPGIRIGYDY